MSVWQVTSVYKRSSNLQNFYLTSVLKLIDNTASVVLPLQAGNKEDIEKFSKRTVKVVPLQNLWLLFFYIMWGICLNRKVDVYLCKLLRQYAVIAGDKAAQWRLQKTFKTNGSACSWGDILNTVICCLCGFNYVPMRSFFRFTDVSLNLSYIKFPFLANDEMNWDHWPTMQ